MRFTVSILFALFLLLSGCSGPSKGQLSPSSPPSLLQGLTTATRTQISVLRHSSRAFEYNIEPSNTQFKVEQRKMAGSPWELDHLFITGLSPEGNYQLLIKNPSGEIIDTRYFKSLDLKMNEVQFAVASCMDDRLPHSVQKNMWQNLIQQKADIHFFIGDNVYGDVGILQKGLAKPEELWRRYAETRNSLSIYQVRKLTPTLAIWDDHDFGQGNGGMDHPHKNESKKTFHAFFAQDPIDSPTEYQKGPGISFHLKMAGQNFYFLDNRTFRTPNKMKKGTHWGEAQEKWLMSGLKKNKSFSWLINGDQFFGAYHKFESFEKNHPENFKQFIKKLKKLPNRVAFISGDRHLFEVMEIKKPDLNYSTLELTTSAIHAKVFPSSWDKSPNPRQIFGITEKYNFATINSRAKGKGALISIKGHGPENSIFYSGKKLIQ